jgi:formylglycine-generating enzyme required for sulfatase activity
MTVDCLITNSIGMKMTLIAPGEFVMGAKGCPYAQPLHRVRITKPFYLGIYPVTQREWKKVMGDDPSGFKGDDNPVEKINWEACQHFVEKLNEMEPGAKYRLPTEAEWEFACRAGSNKVYCFTGEEGYLGQYAWYLENSGAKTHPVGKKAMNAWGLYDVHGNVWEWCSDRFDSNEDDEEEEYYDYYTDCHEQGTVDDPQGPEAGVSHILKGGAWNSEGMQCASGSRFLWDESGRYENFGLRLARDAGP